MITQLSKVRDLGVIFNHFLNFHYHITAICRSTNFHIRILMLTYKSYYNMTPPYLCELINENESPVNTRLGTDHHQLIYATN